MTILHGVIRAFDANDGLGDIELEDGRSIRFGLSALASGLRAEPGTAVKVEGLTTGYGGRLRATAVTDPSEDLLLSEQFEGLLQEPETCAFQLIAAFRELPAGEKDRLGRDLLEWAWTHCGEEEPYRPHAVVADVPLHLWRPEELLRVLEDYLTLEDFNGGVLFLEEEYERLADHTRAVLGQDQRIIDLNRRADERAKQAQEDRNDPLGVRLRTRPRFEDIEQIFAAKLPSVLRASWSLSYESSSPARPLFIHVRGDRLERLKDTAHFVSEEHLQTGELRVVEGKPFPVLPFAESEQDSDYFCLDLSRPTPGGDYSVLYVPHDVIDGIVEVAATSEKWLANPVDPGADE